MDSQQVVNLTRLPTSEDEREQWADALATCLNAEIREREVAADQYCWRLSINHRHWLLFYSEICQAAWLEALEGDIGEVNDQLNDAGYVA